MITQLEDTALVDTEEPNQTQLDLGDSDVQNEFPFQYSEINPYLSQVHWDAVTTALIAEDM